MKTLCLHCLFRKAETKADTGKNSLTELISPHRKNLTHFVGITISCAHSGS